MMPAIHKANWVEAAPHWCIAKIIGPIKAKEDPKKTGILQKRCSE
jgi:hypothetical protein